MYIRTEFCEAGSRLIEFLTGPFVFDGETKSSNFANAPYAYTQYYICICVRVLYDNMCRHVSTYAGDGVRTGSWKRVERGTSHRGHKKSKTYASGYAFLWYLGMSTSS